MLKKFFRGAVAITMSISMLSVMTLTNFSLGSKNVTDVMAAANSTQTIGGGSIGIGTDSQLASKLPTYSNQGTYRFTTDNYNNSHPAIDTTDWATNYLWCLSGNRINNEISGSAYAFPLCYLMKQDGLRVTKASMLSIGTRREGDKVYPANISAYNILDNDTLCDFKLSPNWNSTQCNIDDSTDWTYTSIVKNPNNSSQSMKTIMSHGSPFTYFELSNSNVFYLEKLRVTFPSEIVYEQNYNGVKIIVFRANDITSAVNGYPASAYQYYALYMPENSSVDHLGTQDTTHNDGIGRLKITLPSNKTYLSFAWLCESQSVDNSKGIDVAKAYRPYAFNFITDTRADYSYNESNSTLTTTYSYTVSKKAESTADGTVMGILPHQYKNMTGYTYMNHTAHTLRGYMKFLTGSSYQTKMQYTGILPYMPALPSSDNAGKTTLQNYVNLFADSELLTPSDVTKDTYWRGKALNKSAQAIAAAAAVGDTTNANEILEGLEYELNNWFTYSGAGDDKYFTYYGNGVGSLLGFPESFNSVDQLNDHHFHYGYFIESAACVGMWDPDWLSKYEGVVKQLIYDIACPYRDNSESKCGHAYPYLRSFDPYEGHSWASGYEDERTGNNQESTSEALNAWAGIILFGEVTGNTEIRDLGIYLYTTEVAATQDYWFDMDEDVYHSEGSNYNEVMASMVWGGKADYSTWFGADKTQGIQICPMQSWSFYFLKDAKNITGANYIRKYFNADQTSVAANGGSTQAWNDMWAAYYALVDPSYAMNTLWTKNTINDGESQAHTYHFIQAMIDYGTPDVSYKCSSVLGNVFVKNGTPTYVVANPSSSNKTVTFTAKNGSTKTVTATARATTVVTGNNSVNNASVTQTIDRNSQGGVITAKTSVPKPFGLVATAISDNKINVVWGAGTVNNYNVYIDGARVLSDKPAASYNIDNISSGTHTVMVKAYDGTNESLGAYVTVTVGGVQIETTAQQQNPITQTPTTQTPTTQKQVDVIDPSTITDWNDVRFSDKIDYYCEAGDKVSVTPEIHGDVVYAAYSMAAAFSSVTFDGNTITPRQGADVEVPVSSFTPGYHTLTVVDFYGSNSCTIYFKVAEEQVTEAPTTAQPTTAQPTTPEETSAQGGEGTPLVPFGLSVSCDEDNTIAVVWGQDNERIELGQLYNIYVDDELKLSSVPCGRYVLNNITSGTRTVKVTAVLNGKESAPATGVVEVTGSGETVTSEPTTAQPTTATADDFISLGNADKNQVVGDFTLYQGPSWAGGSLLSYKGTGTNLDMSLRVDNSGTGLWGLQVKYPLSGIENNETYNYTIKYTASKAGNMNIKIEGFENTDPKPVAAIAGQNTYSGTATKSFDANAVVVFALYGFEAGTIINIDEITFTKASENPTEATTEEPTQPSGVVVSDKAVVEGYQMSTTIKDSKNRVGGVRVVASVEPTINNKTVVSYGLVYSLVQFNGTNFDVTEDDMVVGNDNEYVRDFASTSEGQLNVALGKSQTANYFAMTMTFGGSSAKVLSATYKVRTYAELEDGTYVYSDIDTYSVNSVADYLYQNNKMSTEEGHNFLYNNILRVVNPAYKAIEFTWGNAVAKPNEI